MMKRALLVAFAATLSTSAFGETWNCRNPEMEIACADGSCVAETDAFTPMHLAFNTEGEIVACAYSGCWEGRGNARREGRFLTLLAPGLTWSTDPEPGSMRQDVALLLDLQDSVVLFKAGVFAQPMICRQVDDA